jgi:hypothetical protein
MSTAQPPKAPESSAPIVTKAPPAGRKFPCNQCGAKLDFDPSSQALQCPYCGHVEKIAPAEQAAEERDYESYLQKLAGEQTVLPGRTSQVRCGGCGAVVLLDEKIQTDKCPFCATHLENQPEAAQSMIQPEGVLPFTIDLRAARTKFNEWVHSRWFAPNEFRHLADLGQLAGVYLPFWTYDSMTYTYYTGERGDDYTETEEYTETDASGKQVTRTRTVVKTRWYPVSGNVQHFFDDVLVCASKSLQDHEVSHLMPWDLEKLDGFKAEFLSGFQTERYAVGLEEGFAKARDIMDDEIRTLCCRDIGGDHQRLHRVATQHVGVTFKHILLPVWIGTYRYHNELYRIVVNARTGKAYGKRPYSWMKIALTVLAVLAAMVLLFVLVRASGGAQPATASGKSQAAEAPDGALARLLAVYATQPQGYPTAAEYARPDMSVPFRWHGYHEGAVAPYADARMVPHVDPYNPLEDGGVQADKASGVKWQFTPEHATAGKHALRVEFPRDAVQAGKAVVRLQAVAGGTTFSQYLRGNGLMPTASAYGPHYRWIKLDAFNPTAGEVRVRVSGVPFILKPGRNVIAVKTTDAVDRHYRCLFTAIPVEVTAPAQDVTLHLDHVRMEQELPATLSKRGRLFQFPGRSDPKDPPVLAPGFTAIEPDTLYTAERGFGWTAAQTTRQRHAHSFRSNEHGLLWGSCQNIDAPLRIDLPNGRYGIFVFGAPTGGGFQWANGLKALVNGKPQTLLAPRTEAEVRRTALGGEAWDYRPGACVWEALVREPYYPAMELLSAEVTAGRLLLEFPRTLALHALIVFPEAEREAARKELGRLNYLLAESWDVSHPWIKGHYAARSNDGHPYIGAHEEMIRPETIPARLQALKLGDADFRRGFVLFHRGLTEAVYPDTIPTPAEAAVRELRCFAVPGQGECVTLGLLPLAPVQGLRVQVSDLTARGTKAALPAAQVDVRVSRQHQKTMQFGHHNHDYNYQEHYLVRRPAIDLHPGAARRVYFDIRVPAGLAAGEYVGTVTIATAEGKALARVPLVVEVLLIQLETPPVYFASSFADPRLKDYGFNTFVTGYDDAVKHGYRGYVANLGHGARPFQGKNIGWSNFLANKELLGPLLDAGRTGKGPRGFFGGPAPGTYANPKAEAISKEFFASVRKEFPGIDLLGRTLPVFYHGGYKGLQLPHEWGVLAAPPRAHSADLLEAARQSGEPFWFIDGLRHSKEQAGRFTFGLWLWRLGASGRFTTLEALLQYGSGTARSTYRWEPYFTLLDVTPCNVDRALKDSLTEGETNPCRDLLLLRAGIDDYRYVYTLETWMRRAESKKAAADALAAARKFRDELHRELALDLSRYYDARAGAYGENWQALPDNPWKSARFDAVRRQIADHIVRLQQAVGG